MQRHLYKILLYVMRRYVRLYSITFSQTSRNIVILCVNGILFKSKLINKLHFVRFYATRLLLCKHIFLNSDSSPDILEVSFWFLQKSHCWVLVYWIQRKTVKSILSSYATKPLHSELLFFFFNHNYYYSTELYWQGHNTNLDLWTSHA